MAWDTIIEAGPPAHTCAGTGLLGRESLAGKRHAHGGGFRMTEDTPKTIFGHLGGHVFKLISAFQACKYGSREIWAV